MGEALLSLKEYVNTNYGREPDREGIDGLDVEDALPKYRPKRYDLLGKYEEPENSRRLLPTYETNSRAASALRDAVLSKRVFRDTRYGMPKNTEEGFSILDFSTDFLKGLLQGISVPTPEELLGFESFSTRFLSEDAKRKRAERLETKGIGGGIGEFIGSIPKYIVAAKLLGLIGPLAAKTLTAVALRAGITGAFVRAFRAPEPGEEPEDTIDRLHNSLKHGVYATAFVGGLGALGKAWVNFRGGESRYISRLSGKLYTYFTTKKGLNPEQAREAVQIFKDAVHEQGGASALHKAAVGRAKRAATEIDKLNKLRRGVHGIALGKGDKGLALPRESYEKFNLNVTGKASTKHMSEKEMRDLKKFYTEMFIRSGKAPVSPNFIKEMEAFTEDNFIPGFGANFLPQEANLERMGFGKWFYKIYEATVVSREKTKAVNSVLAKWRKASTVAEREQLFDFSVSVSTRPNMTPSEIRSAFVAAARGRPDITNKALEQAIWLRRVTTADWNGIVRMKLASGKALGISSEKIKEEIPNWDMSYLPNMYKAILSARKGLSAAEYNLFRRAMGSGKVIDGFLFDRKQISPEQLALLIKDPFYVTDTAHRAAMRTTHLEPITRALMRYMNTPKLDIPLNTRTYITNWINYGVMSKLTPNDRLWNKTLGFSARHAAARLKAMGYAGTLTFNPATWVKQLLQQELNIANLGRHWLSGVKSIVTSGSKNPLLNEFVIKDASGRLIRTGISGWQFAAKNSLLFRSRKFGILEDLDPQNFSRVLNGILRIGLSPFRFLDSTNIVAGFNGAVSKYVKEGKPLSVAIKLADRMVRNTQYNYLNIETPLAYLSAPGKLMGQYQSWWTHYVEEVWRWGGPMKYDGTSRVARIAGHTLNIAKSAQFQRYLAINASLLAALHMAGVDFGAKRLILTTTGPGVLPGGIPPALDLLLGAGQALIGSAKASYSDDYYSKRLMNEGLFRLKRQTGIHVIPGYTTLRKVYKITQPGLLSDDAERALGLKKKLPWRSLVVPVSSREYQAMLKDSGL